MPDYSDSKIYKLVNSVDEKIYVGSTCGSLRLRKSKHKAAAKKRPNQHVYAHLNSIGWENVRIILIESVFAETKDQLLLREQYWIDLLKPELNKNSAIDTCPHNRQNSQCKECNGIGLCEHNKQKNQCATCNPFKNYCNECQLSFSSNKNLEYHMNSEKHFKKYNELFLEVFGELP